MVTNKTKSMKYALLLIIPIAILINISSEKITDYDFDPNYIYLFNGVNLATQYGKLGHYDNPGTPVIVLSTIVMKITHLVRNTNDDFPIDVLKNPQYYVNVIAWTFSVINTILVFLLGFFILKTTNEITFSLLFQSIPFLSKVIFLWCFRLVSPEPVLLGTVIILIILFLWKYYFNISFGDITIEYAKNQKITIDRFMILFGLLMGFSLATKINTMPLLLLPLLFIPGFSKKFTFLIIVFISFILFTFPIARYYKMLFYWIVSLFLHSGNYGTGSLNIFDLSKVYENLITFIKSEPIIFYTLVFSLVIIIKQIAQKKYNIHLKILGGFFLVQIGFLVMVLKHFELHYFIPVIPTIAVNLFIILQILNLSKTLKLLTIIPFVILCIYLNKGFPIHSSPEYNSTVDENSINIYSYNCNSTMFGLKYGNEYSRNMNTPYLEKVYGKQYFYNLWVHKITDWQDTVTLDALIKKNKPIYLYMFEPYLKDWPTPFNLKKISEGKFLIETQKTDSLEFK